MIFSKSKLKYLVVGEHMHTIPQAYSSLGSDELIVHFMHRSRPNKRHGTIFLDAKGLYIEVHYSPPSNLF